MINQHLCRTELGALAQQRPSPANNAPVATSSNTPAVSTIATTATTPTTSFANAPLCFLGVSGGISGRGAVAEVLPIT